MRKFLAILCIALLSSCGSDGGADNTGQCSALELTEAPTPKILNGTACNESYKSPVVQVLIDMSNGRTGFCSGTMLSPNKVLTAAHCLENAVSVDIVFGVAPEKYAYITASSWNVHPSFTRNANGTLVNDVGIVHSPVTLPVPNLPILTSTSPKVGDSSSIFGYGVASSGASIDGKLRVGAMTLSGVNSNNIYASYEASASNVCVGDSGGPMLLQVGNQQAIIGTTSYGTSSNCRVGETSVFMNLQSPSIQNFIRSIAPDARFN